MSEEVIKTWDIVFRGDKPIAAFAIPGMAKEWIEQEKYRRKDSVARRQITFKGLSEIPLAPSPD